MGSKSKKLAKEIAKATKQTVSKKKGKKYASLIEKYAKKLAKKLYKKKDIEPRVDEVEREEMHKEPKVWNDETSERQSEEFAK